MGYRHYGRIGDIWKHLPLCDIVKIEEISRYVETNSAYYDYDLKKSPEQEYGIGHFIRSSKDNDKLKTSEYYRLAEPLYRKNKYLGSSGQVMNLLKREVKEYVFFDLDHDAILSIEDSANRLGLSDIVKTKNVDSSSGLIKMIPEFDENTFIHIDPYLIHSPNENEDTYLDGFLKASLKGCKCFLWYGFTTLKEKTTLNEIIRNGAKKLGDATQICSEIILKEIQEDCLKFNPGILGCGIWATNISAESQLLISEYADLMVQIYKNAKYNEFRGALYSDLIVNMPIR